MSCSWFSRFTMAAACEAAVAASVAGPCSAAVCALSGEPGSSSGEPEFEWMGHDFPNRFPAPSCWRAAFINGGGDGRVLPVAAIVLSAAGAAICAAVSVAVTVTCMFSKGTDWGIVTKRSAAMRER